MKREMLVAARMTVATLVLTHVDGAMGETFYILSNTTVSAACALYIMAVVRGAPEGKRLESRVLCFFGNTSYSIYLTHLAVLGLMHGLFLGTRPDIATASQVAVTFAALPVAALVGWVFTRLVEERDGQTLFGQPVETMDAPQFERLAGRLGISAVVALDEDEGRLEFLAAGSAFGRPRRVPRLDASRDRRLPVGRPAGDVEGGEGARDRGLLGSQRTEALGELQGLDELDAAAAPAVEGVAEAHRPAGDLAARGLEAEGVARRDHAVRVHARRARRYLAGVIVRMYSYPGNTMKFRFSGKSANPWTRSSEDRCSR